MRRNLDEPSLFPKRLRTLLDSIPGQNGEPMTGAELAARANARGFALSKSRVRQLQHGLAPTFSDVEAISGGLDVDIRYFLEAPGSRRISGVAGERIVQEALTPTADAAVREILIGLIGLSDDAVATVADVIQTLGNRPAQSHSG
ncbi:hypothetical protein DFJ75_4264 [Williamsia muralis]|uniref:DNA-binding protein n=1 Tax=Williamsia marianensis TaxID=85044 RepID=A0A495K7U9_WILMA|nr:hypothetical protein DFJ75_4264 [Williamsia muralis]